MIKTCFAAPVSAVKGTSACDECLISAHLPRDVSQEEDRTQPDQLSVPLAFLWPLEPHCSKSCRPALQGGITPDAAVISSLWLWGGGAFLRENTNLSSLSLFAGADSLSWEKDSVKRLELKLQTNPSGIPRTALWAAIPNPPRPRRGSQRHLEAAGC